MQGFQEFLTEAKNTHLEHLEDEIINNGTKGAKTSIEFLKSIKKMLQGGKGGSFNVNSGVPTDNLAVGGSVDVGGDNTTISGNVSTENLSVAGNIPTDNLTINGTASVNVTVNSVTVNTTVAYSATLWLRYS